MPATARPPCPEPCTCHRGADVISLIGRTPRGRPAGPEAARTPAEGGPADPRLTAIGQQVQAFFGAHGRTLTDTGTATDFTITVDALAGLIDGVLAEGIIGPEQHGMIAALLAAMRQAPSTL